MLSSKKNVTAVMLGVLLTCEATLGQDGAREIPRGIRNRGTTVDESPAASRFVWPSGPHQRGKQRGDERLVAGASDSSGPLESIEGLVLVRVARSGRSEFPGWDGSVGREKAGEGYVLEYAYIGSIGGFSPPGYANLYVGDHSTSIKAEMRATTDLDYCRLETDSSVHEYSFYSRYYEGDSLFFDLDSEEFVRSFGCYAATAGTDGILVYVGTTYFNLAPSDPTRPSGPSSALVGEVLEYRSSADDPSDDLVSLVFDWGDGTLTQTEFDADETEHNAAHAYNQPGRYDIHTYAIDEHGATSNWSSPSSVQVERENVPPNAPSAPVGKDVVFSGEQVEYAVVATDPNGDSLRVTVDWGDATAPTLSASVPSGSKVTVGHTFAQGGMFNIRAFATDSKGLVGSFSNAKSVQVIRPERLNCIMDCNDDDEVTVDEIIVGTIISLGSRSISACTKADLDRSGTVTVDEIVRGIYNSLNGCPR